MKTLVAIKHVDFEDLGSWEAFLSKQYKISYLHAADLPHLENKNIDLLAVLGGPIGVYQEDEYPFIKNEVALLAERLQLDLPTLGICLGSQLMARALGAKVYPNHTKEIGWSSLNLTEAGKNSCIQHLNSSLFHWHGDTFDLPEGAKLLASTEVCKNQVFSYKKNALAFQCHPEVTASGLEKWWIGHAAELSHNSLSVSRLREESQEYAPELQKQALQCLQAWLQ
jgi:GMP synthase (glutamine-hydrolysing)